MRAWLVKAGLLLSAWLPFLLFWIVFTMMYGESFGAALSRAVLTIGSAALLGIVVSRFCAANPWPHEVRLSFYARHFGVAALYAMAWVLSIYCFDAIKRGKLVWPGIAVSQVLGWQFLMGLWLYGVIAGISYAIQTQRRAHANELRALRAEASLNAVRLDALRSRLHPHFLFNALHTIAALTRQDATRAENAIEKLGEMLRYTLRDDREDVVPFHEEWEFTRRYLEFEQLRYETRLTFSAEIDPDSLSCSAPSFALQTLVENAVRHSIAKRPEGGRIQIVARRDSESLQVRVRDDGNRIDESEHGLRYGLRTLRERLDAVYGNRARLTTSSASTGYEVSLTIPCWRANEDDHDD